MPKVDDEHKESRKEQILRAAFDCFGSKGFHQTSMRDICEKADLSAGAVYNYFDGKDDIIETLSEESRNEAELLLQDIEKSDSKNEAVKKILQRISKVLASQKQQGELTMKVHLWSEALQSPKVANVYKENMAHMTTQMGRCIDEVSGTEEDSELSGQDIAQLIIAVYQGAVLQSLLDSDDTHKESLDILSSLFNE